MAPDENKGEDAITASLVEEVTPDENDYSWTSVIPFSHLYFFDEGTTDFNTYMW